VKKNNNKNKNFFKVKSQKNNNYNKLIFLHFSYKIGVKFTKIKFKIIKFKQTNNNIN
jgi:hypothetical protein